jgi:photosystem II stability/assembly factor-like uncharacterized protein
MKKHALRNGFLPWLWLGCIVTGPAQLPGQSWVSIGPEGGAVAKFLQDPANGNNLYMLSVAYPAVFIKSTNQGGSWTAVSTVQGSAASFTVNPKKPSELYMGGYSNFCRSTDSGASWTSIAQNSKSFYAVSVDSFNQNILYGCGYEYTGGNSVMAYYKSTDKGTTWSSTFLSGSSESGYANVLAVDPRNPKNIWIGGYTVSGSIVNPKVFKSTNGGAGWTDATGKLTGTIYDMLIDSVGVKRIFVLTGSGFFKSIDNGLSWSQNAGYVWGYKIAQDPKNKNTLYVGSSAQIYKSTDGGVNWNPYTNGLVTAGSCNGIAVDRTNSAHVFFGGSVGFFKSIDAGVNWSPSNSGLLLSSITSLKMSQGTLYAAFSGDGLYKTTNPMGKAEKPEAVSWTRLPRFYDCHNLTDLQVSPTDPNVLYAFEGGG